MVPQTHLPDKPQTLQEKHLRALALNTHRDLLLLVELDNHSRKRGLQYTY
jgi:hypothetical protein